MNSSRIRNKGGEYRIIYNCGYGEFIQMLGIDPKTGWMKLT